MALAQKFKEIKAQSEAKRLPLYRTLAKELNDKKDEPGLVKLVEHLTTSEGGDSGRAVGPAALNDLLTLISDMDEKSNPHGFDTEELIGLLDKMVPLLRKKEEDMADQLMKALKLVSQCHETFSDDKKSYKDHAKLAAQALNSFNFEKGQCSAGYADQVAWYLDTAEFYLDADMAGQASQQVKKAQKLIGDVPDKKELQTRFKLSFARVLDAERKFLEAAGRYIQISQAADLKEENIIEALKRSVLCAVLAPAGPRRSRTLAMLYSDERTHLLPSFPMLEKMFKGRIIRTREVESFKSLLMEHQKVVNKGQSLLQQAVTEHNLLAASQIYRNIHLTQLGVLLDLEPAKAEKLAWTMIEQGRMKGVIDQVEGYVEFRQTESSASSLYAWDAQIQDVCVQVNESLEAITKRFAQYK